MNFTPIASIPDVSFYQDANTTPQKIDFAKMRSQCEGVIIRAGQNTWIDEDVIYNWGAAKTAGLKRGSYWFYDSRNSPSNQANLWKAALGSDMPEWGLWIDLEESYGGAYKGEANWRKFVEAVQALFPGVKVAIYTANWWWSQQYVTQASYWVTFPLWVAGYDPVQYVVLPKPWETKGSVLWQYTSSGDGLMYGVESLEIDLNYTSQEFYDIFGGGTTPPPNGGSMTETHKGTVTAASLKIRTGPGTTYPEKYPPTGGLVQGDQVYGVLDVPTSWFHFGRIIRKSGVEEIFDGWSSAVGWDQVAPPYMRVEVIETPPPPATETVIEIVVDAAGVTESVKVDGQAWVKG